MAPPRHVTSRHVTPAPPRPTQPPPSSARQDAAPRNPAPCGQSNRAEPVCSISANTGTTRTRDRRSHRCDAGTGPPRQINPARSGPWNNENHCSFSTSASDYKSTNATALLPHRIAGTTCYNVHKAELRFGLGKCNPVASKHGGEGGARARWPRIMYRKDVLQKTTERGRCDGRGR